MATTAKPTLHLAGPRKGLVTLDELKALYRQLTGKEPTEADVREADAIVAKAKGTSA